MGPRQGVAPRNAGRPRRGRRGHRRLVDAVLFDCHDRGHVGGSARAARQWETLRDEGLEWLVLDSTVVQARPAAAGSKQQWDGSGGQSEQPRGHGRGGCGTKMHPAISGLGHPARVILAPGQGAARRPGGGSEPTPRPLTHAALEAWRSCTLRPGRKPGHLASDSSEPRVLSARGTTRAWGPGAIGQAGGPGSARDLGVGEDPLVSLSRRMEPPGRFERRWTRGEPAILRQYSSGQPEHPVSVGRRRPVERKGIEPSTSALRRRPSTPPKSPEVFWPFHLSEPSRNCKESRGSTWKREES